MRAWKERLERVRTKTGECVLQEKEKRKNGSIEAEGRRPLDIAIPGEAL